MNKILNRLKYMSYEKSQILYILLAIKDLPEEWLESISSKCQQSLVLQILC